MGNANVTHLRFGSEEGGSGRSRTEKKVFAEIKVRRARACDVVGPQHTVIDYQVPSPKGCDCLVEG